MFDAVGAGGIEYSFKNIHRKEMVAGGKSMVCKSLWSLGRFDIWGQEKKSQSKIKDTIFKKAL